MRPRALYTIAIGRDPSFRYTLSAMRDYARKVGAEFVLCSELDSSRGLPPTFRVGKRALVEKLQVGRLLERYERVLYMDADVLVSPTAPDIFEAHPDVAAAYMFEEGAIQPCEGYIQQLEAELGVVPNWPRVGEHRAYYNSGVMLLGGAANFFPHVVEHELHRAMGFGLLEQTYFNLLIARHGIAVQCLDAKWNWMNCSGGGLQRRFAHFIHYAGCGFSGRRARFWDAYQDYSALYAGEPGHEISRWVAWDNLRQVGAVALGATLRRVSRQRVSWPRR